jgi:hypothetical protein
MLSGRVVIEAWDCGHGYVVPATRWCVGHISIIISIMCALFYGYIIRCLSIFLPLGTHNVAMHMSFLCPQVWDQENECFSRCFGDAAILSGSALLALLSLGCSACTRQAQAN